MLLNHEQMKQLAEILLESQESLRTELDMIEPDEENIEEHSRISGILDNIFNLQIELLKSLEECNN